LAGANGNQHMSQRRSDPANLYLFGWIIVWWLLPRGT